MSYSRTYNGSVYYSGSVNVSYPASEHGGSKTVHYSGSVPVSVDVYVDTAPFDRSVGECMADVNGLNGAVVAMNGAQVASIAGAGKKISSHVISGFFNMVKTELEQNIAAVSAKFKAVFELLKTNAERVEKQQLIMQDDYNRLCARYSGSFANLDRELEDRIIALDKNVFEISRRVQGEQLNIETSKKAAQTVLSMNESDVLEQKLLVANTKSKVMHAMKRLSDNVSQKISYSNHVKSILNEAVLEDSEECYVPVIFEESLNLDKEDVFYNCYTSFISDSSVLQMQNLVKSSFISKQQLSEKQTEEEKVRIDDAFKVISENEFSNLKDEKSLRVFEMIKKLRENEKLS